MPSATAITLYDGAATPVEHTFTPLGLVGPDLTTLVDLSPSIPADRPRLSISFSPANGKRSTNRVKIGFEYPKGQVDSATGAYVLNYTARFNADVVIPNEMADEDREHLAAYIKNMLADAVISGYVSDLDPIW